MSMVRFFAYANQWDVEGLVATTSVHQRDKVATWRILDFTAPQSCAPVAIELGKSKIALRSYLEQHQTSNVVPPFIW